MTESEQKHPAIRIHVDQQVTIESVHGQEVVEDSTVATEITGFDVEGDAYVLKGAMSFSGFLRVPDAGGDDRLPDAFDDADVFAADSQLADDAPILPLHYRLPFVLQVPVAAQEQQLREGFLDVNPRVGQFNIHILGEQTVHLRAELILQGLSGSEGYVFRCGSQEEGAAAPRLDLLLDREEERQSFLPPQTDTVEEEFDAPFAPPLETGAWHVEEGDLLADARSADVTEEAENEDDWIIESAAEDRDREATELPSHVFDEVLESATLAAHADDQAFEAVAELELRHVEEEEEDDAEILFTPDPNFVFPMPEPGSMWAQQLEANAELYRPEHSTPEQAPLVHDEDNYFPPMPGAVPTTRFDAPNFNQPQFNVPAFDQPVYNQPQFNVPTYGQPTPQQAEEAFVIERSEATDAEEAFVLEGSDAEGVEEAFVLERSEETDAQEAFVLERSEEADVQEAFVLERSEEADAQEAFELERSVAEDAEEAVVLERSAERDEEAVVLERPEGTDEAVAEVEAVDVADAADTAEAVVDAEEEERPVLAEYQFEDEVPQEAAEHPFKVEEVPAVQVMGPKLSFGGKSSDAAEEEAPIKLSALLGESRSRLEQQAQEPVQEQTIEQLYEQVQVQHEHVKESSSSHQESSSHHHHESSSSHSKHAADVEQVQVEAINLAPTHKTYHESSSHHQAEDSAVVYTSQKTKDTEESFWGSIRLGGFEEKAQLKFRIIQSEDSLPKLAERYNTSINELMRANNLQRQDLSEGEVLYIPVAHR